jgi:hypothetical protein
MNSEINGRKLHDCGYNGNGEFECIYNTGTVTTVTLKDLIKDLTPAEKRQLLDDLQMTMRGGDR